MLGVYCRAHAVLAALLDLALQSVDFFFRRVRCHILICLVKLTYLSLLLLVGYLSEESLYSCQRITMFLPENNYQLSSPSLAAGFGLATV